MMKAVCTAVINLDGAAPVPLLLLGVRDEFAARPWRPPGWHWPARPLIGGLDLQAGGTWLAVRPDGSRTACVLNGRGTPAPTHGRRSRGELPLRAAAEGLQGVRAFLDDPAVRERYDPFHLICADPSSVTLLSWDGSTLAGGDLEPGTHLVLNGGHAYASTDHRPTGPARADDPAVPARAAYFGPRFAAGRPSGSACAALDDAWGPWLNLAAGADLPASDPRALIVRRQLADGRVWGTTSVSLVALGRGTVRYDFQRVDPRGTPPVRSPWQTVLAGEPDRPRPQPR